MSTSRSAGVGLRHAVTKALLSEDYSQHSEALTDRVSSGDVLRALGFIKRSTTVERAGAAVKGR
jgi:hypothetical protein